MINTEKIYSEIRAAGLPIYTISGSVINSSVGPVVNLNGAWVEFTRALTGPETTTLNNIVSAHDPVDYPALVEAGAEAQAAAIPAWAGWSEAQALQWLSDNIGTPLTTGRAAVPNPITSFAQVRAVVIGLLDVMDKQYAAQVASTRLLVALRNRVFPKLEGS